jgi:hypothetical protein
VCQPLIFGCLPPNILTHDGFVQADSGDIVAARPEVLAGEVALRADLFKGEEIGNAAHLDLGKIQMFYFTLILVLTYAVMLGAMFSHITQHTSPTGMISGLPSLPDGMVALLGISNGGYLGNKVIPHTAGQ